MTALNGGLFLIDFVLSQICLFEMGSFSVNYTLDLGLLVLPLCLCAFLEPTVILSFGDNCMATGRVF